MNRSERKGLGSAAAIFDAAGQILLVKHSYGRLNWELPGGLADAYESPIETAVREVREEIGLRIRVTSLAGYYYESAEDLVHFVFLCERLDSETPTPDSSEISDWGWWAVDELPRPISDFTIRRIQDSVAGAKLPLPGIVGPRRWIESGAETAI